MSRYWTDFKDQEKRWRVNKTYLLNHLSQNQMSSLVLRNVQLRVHNLREVSDIVKRWQLNRIYHEPARVSLLSGKVHTLAVPDPGFPRGRQPQWWGALTYYYRPQRSCGKVMFLQMSISHSVHRVCVGQTPPPPADISQHALEQTRPLSRHIPACTGADISQYALWQTPPPSRRPLQRTVRILMECILVLAYFFIFRKLHENEKNWTRRGREEHPIRSAPDLL